MLDEHFDAQWRSWSRRHRITRRSKGLGTWRLVRYADDFVVLVNGTRGNVEQVREEAAAVLEPMGLRLSEAKTQIVHMQDGFNFLGFRIVWKRKRGTQKWHVYTFIADKPVQSLKRKIKALTPQVVPCRLQGHAHPDQPDPAWLGQLLQACGGQAHLRPPSRLHLVACRELGNAPSPHALEGPESTATRPERLAADRLGGDRTVQPRLGQRDPLPISGQPHPLALDGTSHHNHGMTSWRAGCGESRTSGSAGGLGKRTPSDRDTAPQVDPTSTGGPQP